MRWWCYFICAHRRRGDLDNLVDRSFQIYLRTFIVLSLKAEPVYVPFNSVQGFCVLHTLVSPLSLPLFGDGHPNRFEVISHGGFG